MSLRKIYGSARRALLKRGKRIVMQPGRYPVLSKALYPIVHLRARMLRVPQLFLDRADDIRAETRSDLSAIRFLRMLIHLRGTSGKGSPFLDFPAMLNSDAERTAAKEMIEARLLEPETSQAPALRHLLHVNMMRLQGVSPEAGEAQELARKMVDASIAAYRKKGHKARDKHFTTEDARTALSELKAHFDKAGKRFFLDRGTLLGAVREGGFISTDYDIDLGVLASEISLDEVEALLVHSDFALIQKNPWKLAYVSELGIQIDFFLTREVDGTFLSSGENEVHIWSFVPFALVPYAFLGSEYFVPENPERQLTQTYGNWQSPTLFYDPSFDEHCVTYGRNLNALMYLVRRLDRALAKRDRFLAEACLRALKEDFDIDRTDLIGRPVAIDEAPEG